MSDLRIDNITDRAGSSGPIIAGVSTVTSTSHMVMPSGPTEMRGGRGRGIIWMNSPSGTKTINKIEIATTANATDFGDSMVSKAKPGVCASSTRGIFSGGQPGASPYYITDIEYVITSSGGGSNDFGDLSYNAEAAGGGASPTRAISAGGTDSGGKILLNIGK